MTQVQTPKTGNEVMVLTNKAVQLAQGIAEEMGMSNGWTEVNLETARGQADELRSILAALWRWAK